MLVSQYELLINKRQFPKPDDLNFPTPLPPEQEEELKTALEALSREVIQGYFLTISNLSNKEVSLVISFRVVSDRDESPFDENNVAAVFDVNGINQTIDLITSNPQTRNYVISLPAKDTGLFIVQPNPGFIPDTDKEVEIRGYVDVSVLLNDGGEEIDLLLTPEHRGTFYKRVIDPVEPDPPFTQLDQIVYSLPTANGGSLFKLS